MNVSEIKEKYIANVKLLFIGAALIIGLWFALETVSILFLFFFAIVLTLVLNAPVMWLVSKRWKRLPAALMVFFMMILFLGLIGWLVVPKVLNESANIVADFPTYYDSLKDQVSAGLSDYPELQQSLSSDSEIVKHLPSMTTIVTGLGFISFSVVGVVFLMVLFFSIVAYMLIDPVPLLQTYLNFFPDKKRPKAAHAMARASKMMVGWMWSNLVVGTMEAIAVFFFLTFMEVPGVWIWVGLALFAEMVPKLGLYIMAIPPVLIAFTIDPLTALWVTIFYLALNEIMGDFVMPKIRQSTMNLHPVSSLLVMLLMVSAFGIMGALIATPLTAFIKAFYEEFFLNNENPNNEQEVKMILERKV